MPSVILTNQSGGQNVLSGWFSGRTALGSVVFKLHPNASGNVYIGLSGGVTIGSGNMSGTFSGALDGYLLTPGQTHTLGKASLGPSGLPQVFVATDAAASGQGRLFFEGF